MSTAGSERRLARSIGLVLLALLVAGCGREPEPEAVSPADATARVENHMDFEAINQEWRERRLARLTEPYGWLSLTGLHLLSPGSAMLGSDADNDIVIERGPARWGWIELDEEGRVWFEAEPGAGVTQNDTPVERIELRIEDGDGPTTLQAEGIRIHLVDPGGAFALRVRDPQAPTRVHFTGLDLYPLDRSWRLEAQFEPHPPGTTLTVANVLGQLIDEPNPGRVRFERGGQVFSLEAVLEDGRLFFIFADRTSGRETYGLGRFLYADLPDASGRVVLDFNQAYNPPCAFNAFTTCPLPPQGNRLDAWIRAGEATYSGPPGITEPRKPQA